MKKLNYKFAQIAGSLCLAFATVIGIGIASYGQIGTEEMPKSMKNLR